MTISNFIFSKKKKKIVSAALDWYYRIELCLREIWIV